MSDPFKQGIKLAFVAGPSPGDGSGVYYQTKPIPYNNHNHVKSITVEMIPGEMAMVSWAKIIRQDDSIVMVNLHKMEEVGLEATDDATRAG